MTFLKYLGRKVKVFLRKRFRDVLSKRGLETNMFGIVLREKGAKNQHGNKYSLERSVTMKTWRLWSGKQRPLLAGYATEEEEDLSL